MAIVCFMPIRKSMNVSLTLELERFVTGRVASGRYQNNSEVVRAALRLLQVQESKDALGIDGADPQPRSFRRSVTHDHECRPVYL